jgi:uncharacterized protein with PIN domain
MIRYLLVGISLTLPALPQSTPQPTFDQKLLEVRSDFRIEGGKLTGNAAPVLEKAISGAQYVLIGEDHITHEIPQFAAAVCDLMAPQGLTAMAVEAGPQAAKMVASSLGKPERLSRMAALTDRYPDSVAFLNVREENDLVDHCAAASHDPKFQLWGLDQELMGSAGWLLDQISATHPGPAATSVLTRMKAEEQKDAAMAKETGDPSKVFLFAASDAQLSEMAAVLKREGNAAANELFHELVESHEIYLKNMQGSADSNSQRARLLKQNFRRDFDAATSNSKRQRILFKFGDWHLYKGFNPLHERDLGNYIAEMADGQGASSLHICILGAKGTHALYAGYQRPMKLEPFVMVQDDDYHWLKPAVDNQVPNAWTLYDLRNLRFQKLGAVDPDMQRVIYGYDLLIIVPEFTPAHAIK